MTALANDKDQLPTPNVPEVADRTGDVVELLPGACSPVNTEV